MKIIDAPSPNQNERKYPIDMLVLHYTGMEDGPSALARMRLEEAQVSSHYMVDDNGDVYQLVPEEMRAWHAGRSSWQGDLDLNSRSIGIEIVNGGHNIPLADGTVPPYTRAQIDAVIELSRDILSRNDIPQHRIVGHSDIAPDRKIDPGEHFPWAELAARGVGLWPVMPDEADVQEQAHRFPTITADTDELVVARLQDQLRIIGYGIEMSGQYDELTGQVVSAFQRRWNQAFVTGIADPLTQILVEKVCELHVNDARGAKATPVG